MEGKHELLIRKFAATAVFVNDGDHGHRKSFFVNDGDFPRGLLLLLPLAAASVDGTTDATPLPNLRDAPPNQEDYVQRVMPPPATKKIVMVFTK